MVLLLTLLRTPASGREPGASSLQPSDALTVQLVVRTRAGLQRRLRHDTFATHGAQEVERIEALGVSVIRVPYDRVRSVERALHRSGYFKSIEPDHIAVATQVPNDPGFTSQWGLTKIGAPAAWNVSLGSSGVIVAIVDSGVDARHPDLRNQLVPGYDFVNDDADAADDNGHGTQMAGIIAAEAFNGLGVAGVAPHCTLMPIKVLDASATGVYSAIANGITYAADHGARVINLSLAGSEASPILESAVDYAAARGALVIAAAGNDGTGDPAYPAAYTNAVAVSATDQRDKVASFSNYGSWVAFAAPGVDILTTNWSASGGASYATTAGTSAATAFVSGAFALLLSAHPEWSAATAVSTLTNGARDLATGGWDPYSGWGRIDVASALNGTPASPIPTVAPDRKPPSVTIVSPVRNSLVYGQVGIDVTATDDIGVASVVLIVDGQPVATDTAPQFSFLWDSSAVSPGKHTLRARAYDAAGNARTSKAVRISVTHGVGMSITRARLTTSPSGTLSLAGIIALPDGVARAQGLSSLTLTLSSRKGTVISAGMRFDASTENGPRNGRLVANGVDPQGAVVQVRITPVRQGPTAKLSVTGTDLDFANADSTMGLTLAIDGTMLSQGLTFRLDKSGFVFP
jgi:thermitase